MMVIERKDFSKKGDKLGMGKSISLNQNSEAKNITMKTEIKVGTWKYYYENKAISKNRKI